MAKRKPKFKIELNDEQKKAKALILKNPINILTGKAGSGKTLLACQIGLDLLIRGEISRLLITRPIVTADEDMGFLPGDQRDKLAPYLAPLRENFIILHDKIDVEKKLESGEIDIFPIGFGRGRTLHNELLIVDETQNITVKQMKLLLGRIGNGSKIIFTGDIDQCDLPNCYEKTNSLSILEEMSNAIDGFTYSELLKNHRHPIVDDIFDFFNSQK
jgi:phosphate starvation-inducible PhoH-like protein